MCLALSAVYILSDQKYDVRLVLSPAFILSNQKYYVFGPINRQCMGTVGAHKRVESALLRVVRTPCMAVRTFLALFPHPN